MVVFSGLQIFLGYITRFATTDNNFLQSRAMSYHHLVS